MPFAEFVITPVFAHLALHKILVDGRQLHRQSLVQNVYDFRITFHARTPRTNTLPQLRNEGNLVPKAFGTRIEMNMIVSHSNSTAGQIWPSFYNSPFPFAGLSWRKTSFSISFLCWPSARRSWSSRARRPFTASCIWSSRCFLWPPFLPCW